MPSGIVGKAGVTAIEISAAGVTDRAVEPLIVPNVAVTVALPNATLAATPRLLMVATLTSLVTQVTEVVITRVLPLL